MVTTEMKLTMVDGKDCAALSGTPSSSTCYICRARPSEMNDLERVKQKTEIVSNFEFGLSTLHACIRSMECILHITHWLEIWNWSVAMKEDKLWRILCYQSAYIPKRVLRPVRRMSSTFDSSTHE